jgi:hypothetical protein
LKEVFLSEYERERECRKLEGEKEKDVVVIL